MLPKLFYFGEFSKGGFYIEDNGVHPHQNLITSLKSFFVLLS